MLDTAQYPTIPGRWSKEMQVQVQDPRRVLVEVAVSIVGGGGGGRWLEWVRSLRRLGSWGSSSSSSNLLLGGDPCSAAQLFGFWWVSRAQSRFCLLHFSR